MTLRPFLEDPDEGGALFVKKKIITERNGDPLGCKNGDQRAKRSSALVRRETFASYCFLLPSLIFFLGFVIYPMVLCVVTSFFDSTMNRADIFVGLANYKELFTDPIFLGALKNTFIIVVVSVP